MSRTGRRILGNRLDCAQKAGSLRTSSHHGVSPRQAEPAVTGAADRVLEPARQAHLERVLAGVLDLE